MESNTPWGNAYRLVAAEKWRKQSAEMGRAATLALVEYSQPRPGIRVLDLASGTGEPAISMAQQVGPQGSVAALDVNPELLEIAQGRARQRGLSNLSFHPADAHHLPFPDASFDLVTCRFGVMFFHDVAQALREAHRVLKPNGRASFLAWGPFDQPYWMTTIGVVLRHVGGPLLPLGAPDPFRFARPGSLPQELRTAGFTALHEEAREVPWPWPGRPEEVWQYAQAVSAPFRPLLDRIPPEQWDTINADVLSEIGKFQREGAVRFHAKVVLASGQKH
jgi:SAM-dependent methyltransferase